MRAARSSTVNALANSARPPRRVGWLIAISARLPAPLLLALRIAARRPRRVVLGVASIAITVSGLYVVLMLNSFLGTQPRAGGYDEAQVQQQSRAALTLATARHSAGNRPRGSGTHGGSGAPRRPPTRELDPASQSRMTRRSRSRRVNG
jgi:hypothetical protein